MKNSDQLIGKTVMGVSEEKSVDGNIIIIHFTDFTSCVFVPGHGEFNPACDDEYPDFINIETRD